MSTLETIWRVRWGWLAHGQRTEWVKYYELKDAAQREVEFCRSCGWDAEVLEFCLAKTGATGTEQRVCDDVASRQRLGIAKYGTTVEANPLSLREWLQHSYEECLDQAVYLRRAIQELDSKEQKECGTQQNQQ